MNNSGGERRGVHAGEEVVGTRWGPPSGGVGDATAPLENEGQGCERKREESEEEEELRCESLR